MIELLWWILEQKNMRSYSQSQSAAGMADIRNPPIRRSYQETTDLLSQSSQTLLTKQPYLWKRCCRNRSHISVCGCGVKCETVFFRGAFWRGLQYVRVRAAVDLPMLWCHIRRSARWDLSSPDRARRFNSWNILKSWWLVVSMFLCRKMNLAPPIIRWGHIAQSNR